MATRNSRRKRKLPSSSDGDDSDHDEREKRTKVEEEPEAEGLKAAKDELPAEEAIDSAEIVCSCPKNIVRCIGILPSLPMVYKICDSDDSDSSSDDNKPHVLLPRAERRKNEHEDS